MKRITNIILGAAVIMSAAASCKKDDAVVLLDKALVGEWHLTETNVEGTVLDEDLADVYVIFAADGTFELYQKTGSSMRYYKYSGTCTTEGNKTLIGTYSDGTPWGSVYTYSAGASLLSLTTKDGMETQTYEKDSMDQEDKDNAYVVTKATPTENKPIL